MILAIDQGTTGSTAILQSDEGEVLARAYQELSQHYPRSGWVEHDPEEILESSLSVMARALHSSGREAKDLRAIGITNQRETTVLWDRRTGVPVHRAVVWQSRQTSEICERLTAQGHGELLRRRTGLVVDPYFSGTKIRWILESHPEAMEGARSGDVLFGTIDTWLLWKLTGVHATDPTNASRTLLYDIRERTWHPELLRALDVPAEMLPQVLPSAGVFGHTRVFPGLPPGVPVSGIAGDQQAALFGQGCTKPGLAKNTYGTGCFAMLNTGDKSPRSEKGLLTTLACGPGGKTCFALEGSVFVAGAEIQWLRDEVGLISKAEETSSIAESLPGNEGVYVVPAFVGLGTPHWDMNARGAIVGLTRGTGRRHIVRATLESIAYQTRDVIDAMNSEAGGRLEELRVDGGATTNDFLMQFQADILGVPVVRPAFIEATALGAARLAGCGIGLWTDDVVRSDGARERRFEPRMGEDQRESLYQGWKAAVERVRTTV